jgi:hypothetical protein
MRQHDPKSALTPRCSRAADLKVSTMFRGRRRTRSRSASIEAASPGLKPNNVSRPRPDEACPQVPFHIPIRAADSARRVRSSVRAGAPGRYLIPVLDIVCCPIHSAPRPSPTSTGRRTCQWRHDRESACQTRAGSTDSVARADCQRCIRPSRSSGCTIEKAGAAVVGPGLTCVAFPLAAVRPPRLASATHTTEVVASAKTGNASLRRRSCSALTLSERS